MKKALKYIFIISALMLIITCVSYFSPHFSADEPKSVRTDGYIVREYNGKIAVYKESDDPDGVPREITDIYVKSLPLKDRARIKNGIAAANDGELLRILEDYDG